MTKALGIGLFVAVAVASVGGKLYAEASDLDCSSIKKFNEDHSYDKGDLVTYTDRGKAGTGEYRCGELDCSREMPYTSHWERLGECKYGSAK